MSKLFPFVPIASIAGLVVLLLVAYAILFMTGEVPDLNIPAAGLVALNPSLAAIQDASARFVWAIAAVVQTLVCFLVIAYFSIVMRASMRKWQFVKIISVLLLVGIVTFGTGLFYTFTGKADFGRLPTNLLRQAAHRVNNRVLAVAIDFENALTLLLGLTAAAAVGAVLGSSHQSERTEVELQIERLRRLLNASTAALTAGVVQVFFEYRWVAAVLFPTAGSDASKSLTDFGGTTASSITLAAGGALSLFLVACFAPSAAIIKYRVDEINKGLVANEQIVFGWNDLWKDAVKIIIPVFTAGPLAALFKG